MRPETVEFPHSMPVKAFVRSIEQYPYHWHDAPEIVQVLKGSLISAWAMITSSLMKMA
ncbi:hypothetical protein SPSYN_00014 [Sporotomaculum syntrophicum]|uniref:Uncharacterized protein n=1 Tax=Sporotomaculum syntrophicum TaxID=182264 RepID=A0A9D2WRH6_9FIRM|nr:hypothetical protein [Sporotomaculum syntrophicum]KAF1086297.1 hypothetical protein SPSYN_00014 [Sporotomaculum syntrophicum]